MAGVRPVDDTAADRRRRERMVRDLGDDCPDARVRAAMQAVPRHACVPPLAAASAYDDCALPIGHGATISQPRVVAWMLSQLAVAPGQRILDVGAGSLYAATLLALLTGPAGAVVAVERLAGLRAAWAPVLAFVAGRDDAAPLTALIADGAAGHPDRAPYDRIHVACACRAVPAALVDQLAAGGRMVLPVGSANDQHLLVIAKDDAGHVAEERSWPVRFVPLKAGTTT